MKFEDWLYEVENNSLRAERLYEEVPTESPSSLIKWLIAAYRAGYDHSESRFMDDGK